MPRQPCRNSTKIIGVTAPIANQIPNDPRHIHLAYTDNAGSAPCPAMGAGTVPLTPSHDGPA